MNDLPVLYMDDSIESKRAQDELVRRNLDFVPLVVSDHSTRLPALRVGNQVLIGFGDIALYFLRRAPAGSSRRVG
jgi:hypothetical protein